MKKLNYSPYVFCLCCLFFGALNPVFAQDIGCRLVGVKIKVPDLAIAKNFYCDVLGFELEKDEPTSQSLVLKTGGYKIILVATAKAVYIKERGSSATSICLQVNHLDSTYQYLKSKNVAFVKEEKRPEGIGHSLLMVDPFGNPLSIMQLTNPKKRVVEPAIFNCGVNVPNIELSLKTYTALGFIEGTRKYMPDDMPLLYADKKFAFMLHIKRSDMPYQANPNMALVLSVASEAHLKQLKEKVKVKKQNGAYMLVDEAGVNTEIIIEKAL
jgi:catechol 2,3-dioxygenase-like lactoylglutathione lyase family enzyme